MKQKHKNKTNPFESVLLDNERVLWSHTAWTLSFGAYCRPRLYPLIGSLFGLSAINSLLIWIIVYSEQSSLGSAITFALTWGFYLFWILLFVVGPIYILGGYPIARWFHKQSDRSAYAITNQRIIRMNADELIAISLNRVMLGTVAQQAGTITFLENETMPPWTDIGNTARAVKWIKRAKEMIPGEPL